MKTIEMQTEVLVIGGGLPGVCAAIAAAREGAKVVLMEKSATLGGNCGPELGVHPSDGHRLHPYLAATGIVGELIESAVRYNAKTLSSDLHYNVNMQWHVVMRQALADAGVTLLLRHYAHTPEMDGSKIKRVIAEDTATYKRVIVETKIVVEASGDGNVAVEAGAEFRVGREAQSEYGERLAPKVADSITLGTSLVGIVRRTDREVKFVPPENTPEFHPGYWGWLYFKPAPEENLRFFFPTETGGEIDTIEDDHLIYERLLGQLYSAWDRIKNVAFVEESKNWELVWVSPRVGKRESRRFFGDYTLTETDVESGRIFDDAVAIGGFYTDVHDPCADNPQYVEPKVYSVPPSYTVPFRALYSRNIDNLLFASRLLSATHIAHASVRVQRTLAMIGQASGTAAAICAKKDLTPRELGKTGIRELQQTLLKNDATLPIQEQDLGKIATAKFSADSERKQEITDATDFAPVKKNFGAQIWNFLPKLDFASLDLRNTTDSAVEARLGLYRFSPKQTWQDTRLQFGTFDRFAVANETEWGLDNRKENYQKIAESTACVESGFVGEVIFPFGVDMIAKDAMNDEDKLLLIFETDCDGLEIAVSKTPYDFARLVLGSTDSEYTVTDGSVRFTLSPNPRFGEAENVVDGYARRFSTNPTHMWSPTRLPATLTARFDTPVTAKTCTVYIDTITRAYRQEPFECGKKASPQCAKDFRVEFYSDGVCVAKREIADNAVRKRTVDAPSEVFNEIRVMLLTTWENELPGIYKITID